MIVMGIDPSLRYTGIVVVGFDQRKVYEAVCYSTKKEDGRHPIRIGEDIFYEGVKPLLKHHLPVVFGIELAVATSIQRAPTLFNQGLVIGSLVGHLTEDVGGQFLEYVHPSATKSVLGKGVKTKDDVVEAVKAQFEGIEDLLKGKTKPEREAICDACGVAYAAYLMARD